VFESLQRSTFNSWEDCLIAWQSFPSKTLSIFFPIITSVSKQFYLNLLLSFAKVEVYAAENNWHSAELLGIIQSSFDKKANVLTT